MVFSFMLFWLISLIRIKKPLLHIAAKQGHPLTIEVCFSYGTTLTKVH